MPTRVSLSGIRVLGSALVALLMVCSAQAETPSGAEHESMTVDSSGVNGNLWNFDSTGVEDTDVWETGGEAIGNDETDNGELKSEPPEARQATLPSKPQDLIQEAELDERMLALRTKIRETLGAYSEKHLNTWQHSPWEIMHSIIAFGVDTKLRVEGPDGDPITAIGWLAYNRRGNSLNLFYRDSQGIAAMNGPGMQGHGGQFMAMMAQSKVKLDYPMKVDNQDYTIADLVKYEKGTCRAGTELTFKLIGLVHYLGSDAKWKSRYGEDWSIERLVREELAQPIRGATCGGTHRLMGFSYALRKRAKEGKPMTGQFSRARKFINDYHSYTLKLQNNDGSFSTEWFRGRGNRHDVDRKMQTTGHVLEWMVYSLPQKNLQDEQMVNAVECLTNILHNQENRRWKVGPLGHALHALVLYDQRVFQEKKSRTKTARAESVGKKISDGKVAR